MQLLAEVRLQSSVYFPCFISCYAVVLAMRVSLAMRVYACSFTLLQNLIIKFVIISCLELKFEVCFAKHLSASL